MVVVVVITAVVLLVCDFGVSVLCAAFLLVVTVGSDVMGLRAGRVVVTTPAG